MVMVQDCQALVGQRFHHLLVVGVTTVITKTGRIAHRCVCRCDCGQERLHPPSRLGKPTGAKSCGACEFKNETVRRKLADELEPLVPFGDATVTLLCGHTLKFYDTAPPYVREDVWCWTCDEFSYVTDVQVIRPRESVADLLSDQRRQVELDARERMNALRASLKKPA